MAIRNAVIRQMAIVTGAKYDGSKGVEPVLFLDSDGDPIEFGTGVVNRVIARPVHDQTVAASVPTSLPTPWTATIHVDAGSDVDYDIHAVLRCAGSQPTFYAYLYRDGTLIDQTVFGGSYGTNGMSVPLDFKGTDESLTAGDHVYEVKIRTNGGETVAIVNVIGATLTYNVAQGKSIMRLTEVH